MTSAIEIRELPEMRLLVKKTTCSQNAIGPAFGKAVHSVGACIKANSGIMKSMPYGVYLNWRAEDCDLAAGCEADGIATLQDGCEWLVLAAGPHAFASHFGAYEKLNETHSAIMAWCAANSKKMVGACFEAYPVDPGSEPDIEKWRTDVYYPVV